MYKNILIPVDGSEGSALAMEHTAKMTENLKNARILVVHVVDINHLQTYSGKMGSVFYKVKESMCQQGEELLDEVKAKFKEKNINVETKLIMGDLPYDIVAASIKEKCDLIIMGSRGSGGIESLLLGSVSNYVSKHARCTVMIVRS